MTESSLTTLIDIGNEIQGEDEEKWKDFEIVRTDFSTVFPNVLLVPYTHLTLPTLHSVSDWAVCIFF